MAKKNKKRLLTLVDSFDIILEQSGDERDNARLRDVLMNDGVLMLVGGATTFFKEARAYEQPLYNLFKIYNLQGLTSDQIHELLRRRAKSDGKEDFDETLRAKASRLRVLEYFTGGNPRLVMMLYRVLTHSSHFEISALVRSTTNVEQWRFLRKLMGPSSADEPLFPLARALEYIIEGDETLIEKLSPEVRKIVDEIIASLKGSSPATASKKKSTKRRGFRQPK